MKRVSGLNATTAKNIVAYREENGLHRPEAAAEGAQAGPQGLSAERRLFAGSRECPGADNTAVHPESYEAAEKLLTLCGYTLEDVSGVI